MKAFIEGYIDSIFANAKNDDDDPINEFACEDFSKAAVRMIREDCKSFFEECSTLIGDNAEQAGKAFWLARNGDKNAFNVDLFGDNAGALQLKSESYGVCEVYENVTRFGEFTSLGMGKVVTKIDPEIWLKLQTTLIKHDARESKSKSYNPYALAHYCKAMNRVEKAIGRGTSVARALYDVFSDRILTKLEKAAGVPVTYGGGGKDTGRPA